VAVQQRVAGAGNAEEADASHPQHLILSNPVAADMHVPQRYDKREVFGEGTYGVVNEALDKTTGQTVAIKKLRQCRTRDGASAGALREIKLLQELHHPNIIKMIDVYTQTGNINLVFEECTTDLETVIMDKTVEITTSHIKSYMSMMLRGIHHCHTNNILHRDIKPNNLMFDQGGRMKIIDFGMARQYDPNQNHEMTNQVVSRWYRAPELFFGCRHYGPSIDMWSVGCILAELLQRKPLFPGESDLGQLGGIFKVLGTPTEETWPDAKELPYYVEYNQMLPPDKHSLFPEATPETLQLLSQLLYYDPKGRSSAAHAMEHPFFTAGPPAVAEENLPLPTPPEREKQKQQQRKVGEQGLFGAEGGGILGQGQQLFGADQAQDTHEESTNPGPCRGKLNFGF
jgi:cyclin-dependent kinase 7